MATKKLQIVDSPWKDAVTVDLENSENGNVPSTNSDRLGGLAASEYATKMHVESNYALKTDTAPDSEKLGGLLPENYAVKTDAVMKSGDTMLGDLTVPNLYVSGTEIRDLFFPVGSIYVTSTNTSPAGRLGGKWTLKNKHFTSNRFSSADFMSYDTSVVTANTSYAQRNGDTITINFSVKPVAAWDDGTYTMGTINLETLGISSIDSIKYFLMQGDGAGGLAECYINTDGTLVCNDTVGVDGADTLVAANTIGGHVTLTIGKDYKLDSACNEFIWVRTA